MENKIVDKKHKKWSKIPLRKELILIEMVFHQEFKIKQAAEIVGINYATAKHIIQRYRNTQIIKKNPDIKECKRCSYKSISFTKPNFSILCLQGGRKLMKSSINK